MNYNIMNDHLTTDSLSININDITSLEYKLSTGTIVGHVIVYAVVIPLLLQSYFKTSDVWKIVLVVLFFISAFLPLTNDYTLHITTKTSKHKITASKKEIFNLKSDLQMFMNNQKNT